jgi:hypothetical protein
MPNVSYIGNYEILFSEKWSEKTAMIEISKAIPDSPKYAFPKRGEKTYIGLSRATEIVIELVSRNLYSVIIRKDLNVPELKEN